MFLNPQGVLTVNIQFNTAQSLLQRKESLSNINLVNSYDKFQGVFGVPIEKISLPGLSYVPFTVIRCARAVELYGLDQVGIYRLSANKLNVLELKSLIDKNKEFSFSPFSGQLMKDNKKLSIHVISCLLKQYLTDLPEPLLTEKLYQNYLDCADITDIEQKIALFKAINNYLPKPNFSTFLFLMSHLVQVEKKKDINQMGFQSLATCMGPAILYSRDTSRWNPIKGNKLIEFALSNWEIIYPSVSHQSTFKINSTKQKKKNVENVKLYSIDIENSQNFESKFVLSSNSFKKEQNSLEPSENFSLVTNLITNSRSVENLCSEKTDEETFDFEMSEVKVSQSKSFVSDKELLSCMDAKAKYILNYSSQTKESIDCPNFVPVLHRILFFENLITKNK